jgi:hypothetical protein
MEKTSIFYYTNNLIPKDLLEYTLREAIGHAEKNSCEMIITSHFPVMENYEEISSLQEGAEHYSQEKDIYQYIIKNLRIKNSNPNIKNYVVGKLPYSYSSIFKQMMLSMELSEKENIILMEHDCLYPEDYISVIEMALNKYGKDFAYSSHNSTFLNHNGFFDIKIESFTMSKCSCKRKLFQKIISNKLSLMQQNKKVEFEPVLNIMNSDPIKKYPDEILVNNHLRIDTFLGKYHSVMDIKHLLNADGYLHGEYYDSHPYWGKSEKYIKLLNSIDINDENNLKWCYGTSKFNY